MNNDVFLQSLGLVLLLSGVGAGYRYWITPYGSTLPGHPRGLLLLLLVTLMGGLIGSPFWWLDEPRSFAWDMPPLISRMLAAAGWAFVVVCFRALQRPVWRRVRLVLVLLAIYLIPLALAALLWHRNRFDFMAPIAYVFFALVVLLVLGTCWYLLYQPVIIPETSQDTLPSPAWIRAWLLFITCLTGLWGAALFVTATGPWAWVWAWPTDALSSRLIGVMLLALASGAFYSRHYADVARSMLATLSIYGVGIALAGAWNIVAGKPLRVDYVVAFGSIGIISFLCLVLSSRPVSATRL